MNLRISINAKRIEGAYGGGNQFANTLEKYLVSQGHQVFRSLVPRLDLILILAAQKELNITAYDTNGIADYVILHPDTVVIHRVNTCDEQRGANLGINRAVLAANCVADHTVFVSSFMKKHYQDRGFDLNRPHTIIHTGADESVFNPSGRAEWYDGQKLKIVTHHWSTNFLKGFDIYERLDQSLGIDFYNALFEFTYVGNVPVGLLFRHTQVISPTSGMELAAVLKQNHLYVSAARHEPAGNHYIEAMQCGLPILYLNSGSLPEYCTSFGIEFDLTDFEAKLLKMREEFAPLRQHVLDYSHNGTEMSRQYETLFRDLVLARRTDPRPRPGLDRVLISQTQSTLRRLSTLRRRVVGKLGS